MADYKGLTIKFSGDATSLEEALESINKRSEKTQANLEKLGAGASFGYGLMQNGQLIKSFGDSLTKLGDRLSIFSAAMLVTFGRSMIHSVEEFGNVVSQVGGYLDIDGDKLERMRDLALYVGKETQYSATEAAQAMAELAKGGLTDAQIAAGALDATMQLAAAGQMDFATAATVTVQALKAFSLSAEDSTVVADALAGAATNSVATVESLSGAFAYVSSWAREAGWSVNDVSGALALLSDYGIEAEMAGTALRNVLLRLAAPTDKARGVMEKYGIEVRDAYGNMKSAVEIVDELNISLGGLQADERDAVISSIFGTRGANAALALMDAGSAKLEQYIGYTHELGAAARMTQAQMGDLGWALEYLRGEAETASVNFMSSLEPTLIELAHAAENVFKWFNALSEEERKHVVNMTLMAVGIGPILSIAGRVISVIGTITSGLGAAILGTSAFVATLNSTGSAMKGLSTAIGATQFINVAAASEKATAAVRALELGLYGLVGIAVIAAGAVLWKLTEGWRKAREEARLFQERTEKLNGAVGVMGDTALSSVPSVEKASGAYHNLGYEAYTSAEHIDSLAEEHRNLAEQMESRNKSAQGTIDTLSTAKRFIDEYAGAEHLAAEEVAKLQWALDVVNQETGHNYELMYAYSGVIGENGEAVDNLTDSLDALIDARIREAQAAAISANLTEAYKEQYELERSKSEIERVLALKRAQLDELNADMANGFYDYNSASYNAALRRADELSSDIAELEQSLNGVDGMMQDNARTIDFYTEKYAELNGEIDSTDALLATLIHNAGEGVYGRLNDRDEEFANRLLRVNQQLEKNKQATIDYTQFTAEQWSALVTALNADGYKLEDMLALVTGNLDLASSDWRGIIEQWAADNGVTTEQAMAAISEGIKNGEVDVSNGLQGVLESSVGLAKEKASKASNDAGKDTVEEIADGMTSEEAKKKAEQAAATVLRVIGGAFKKTKPMNDAGTAGGVAYGSGFTSPTAKAMTGGSAASLAQFAVSKLRETGGASDAGGKLVGEYKSGIEDSASTVASATEYVKSVAQSHLDSNGKSYEWGKHLVENFADGIEDSTWRVSNATSEIERVVALSLKHSKPKTGLLADDDVWGLHFVQNFASGIDRGIPLLERSVDGMASTLGWGVNDQSLYMSAGSGYGSATAIYVDGNAIVTDARLQAASENFMRELARKADM